MNDTEPQAPTIPEGPPEEGTPEPPAKEPVKKGALAVVVVILLSMVWYLFSDRFTPYTQQARVQGFVVGIAPKVAGLVTQVWVKNNQEVEANQPLFEIDRAQYEIALKRAQSDLQKAKSQIDASSAGIESARANLRVAEANLVKAQQDAERMETLYREDPGTISVRQLEVARASLEEARARVAAAQSEVQRAIEQKGGEDDDNANLKSAQSAVEKAELDLTDTLVRASTQGIITDLRTEVGQFAAAGNPVMTLIAIRDLWITAEFTENNLGHIQADSPVELVFDALPGEVFAGKVRSIGLGVSSGSSAPAGTLPTIENSRDWLRLSQRFPVVIDFDLARLDRLRGQLRIGGQVEVIAYSEGHGFLHLLGKLYIRFKSWLTYAY